MEPCNIGGSNNNGADQDISFKNMEYTNKAGKKIVLGNFELRTCCRDTCQKCQSGVNDSMTF